MPDPITRLNAALEGRYRIESELGEGGMATVYLADDLKHERKVALKVLKPELAAVVGAERFLAEIKTTASLTHPNILPLHDSGEADSFLFYVMPYVDGESLRDRLDREHQLPVDDAVRIATNMAEALDYAHRQGVIHRDIKPANVLLQDGKPVISDFGIALAVGAARGGRLTETGLSLGTPHYMSPEQATGDQHVGPASDIYALGCVLYEMLVGEPPFTGSTPQAILGKIITGEAPDATQGRRTVPDGINSVIKKALEKVPADRFATPREFCEALAQPDFVWSSGGSHRPARWRPILFGAVSIGVVFLGTAFWMSDLRLTRLGADGLEPDTGSPAETRSVGTRLLVIPPSNQSADADLDPLADRLADAIRRSVQEESDANVGERIGRAEVGERRTQLLQLLAETGVTHAVTGSFYSSTDSLVLALEILDARGETVRVLDEVSAHRDAPEVLVASAADQVAAAILDLMFQDGFEFSYWSLPRTARAMRLYQRSMFDFNEARYGGATDLLIEAIAAEPDWPRPYWILRQTSGMAGRRDEVWPSYSAKFDSLQDRLSADEELYIVWQTSTNREARLEAAERRFDMASGGSTTGYQLASAASTLNHLSRARAAIEAQDFDHAEMREWPLAWRVRGQIYHLVQDYESELIGAREGRQRMPERFWLGFLESRALAALGQDEAAMAIYGDMTVIQTTAGSDNPVTETRRLWNALHEASYEFRLHGGAELEKQALQVFEEWAFSVELSRFQLAQTYYRLGRYEEALPLLEDEFEATEGVNRLPPGALLAITYDRLGDGSSADAVEARLGHPTGNTNWRRLWPPLAAAGRGDTDRAIALLTEAFSEGVPYYPLTEDFLHFRSEFEPLRSDPRFQQLIAPLSN